jgi:S1-C subfamily serine protease
MKPAALLLVLPLLLALDNTAFADKPAHTYTPVELAERIDRATTVILFQTDEDTHWCSAFMVDAANGWLLTVRHCVPGPNTVVFTRDHVTHDVLGVSNHLALVQTEAMSMSPLAIRHSEPKQGEPVVAAGYPRFLGIDDAVRERFVIRFSIFSRTVAALDHGDVGLDGPLNSGMSGGPIVDLHGEVVGISQVSDEVTGGGCGADEIRAFLKDATKGGQHTSSK